MTPYDVYVNDEDKVVAKFSTPGFSKEDLTVRCSDGYLGVQGKRKPATLQTYVVKGIPDKDMFNTRLRIGPHYEVEGATYLNGMLEVTLKRIDTEPGVVIPIS